MPILKPMQIPPRTPFPMTTLLKASQTLRLKKEKRRLVKLSWARKFQTKPMKIKKELTVLEL